MDRELSLISIDLIVPLFDCPHRHCSYAGDVKSDDLKPEQARKLMATVAKQLRFLNRLCGRMSALGFPPNDPLWRAASEARNAMQDLHVASHYAGCKTGVGREGETAIAGPRNRREAQEKRAG